MTDLTAFCARVRGRLDEATFADKQAILQLVIERIIVGDGSLEIRHVIPLRSPPPGRRDTAEPRMVDCVRIVCTRHLCQVAPSTRRIAALSPRARPRSPA